MDNRALNLRDEGSDVRVDGIAKVTGTARYTGDLTAARLAHAVIIDAPIANGRIVSIDDEIIRRMPGVAGVLTHLNVAEIRGAPPPAWPADPEEFMRRRDQGAALALADDRVRRAGQPVAVVIAETLVEAQAAAQALRIEYDPRPPKLGLEAFRHEAIEPVSGEIPGGEPASSRRGNLNEAIAKADVLVRSSYRSPTAHQNPIEPSVTLVEWSGDKLTVYDSNQGPHAIVGPLASSLDLPEENVRVISGFVGGGFGGKLQLWPHGYLAALAARLAGRPVRLALSRRQMFTGVGPRPELIQDVVLAATADAKLLGIGHDAIIQAGIADEFVEAAVGETRKRYACRNVSTSSRLVHLNMPGGAPMRAPGKSTGGFALECAMDELAEALAIDPIDLRQRNFAENDQEADRPWSSNYLRECYRSGVECFAWPAINAERSWQEGRAAIGLGMAAGSYPLYQFPSSARVTLKDDGQVVVGAGVSEIGVGNPTVLPRIAAEVLGIPFERVSLDFGDTDLPYAPLAGGSRTIASVGGAIVAACHELRRKALEFSDTEAFAPDLIAQGLRECGVSALIGDADWEPAKNAKFSSESFAAHFCEVAVSDTGEVRVRRFLSAIDAGRILNPMTARSQIIGAVTMGIGQALFEGSTVDHRSGQFVNDNLAEYLVPTHADIPEIEVLFCGEHDPHAGAVGTKSIGEIGIVGVAAAVANAVYQATGIRVRELPITPEKLLAMAH